MKMLLRIRVPVILCFVCFIWSSECFGQVELKGVPLSRKELRWMSQNGFDATNIEWQNPALNPLLKKALDQRKRSNSRLGVGILLSSGFIFWGHVANEFSDTGKKEGNSSIIIGTGVLLGSVVNYILLRKSSREKLRKAQAIRYKM